MAWLSPDAVTATDASLKVEATVRRGRVSASLRGCWGRLGAPVEGEIEDLGRVAAILGHQAARASVPQPQLSVQAARGHHSRRLLPLQVDDAHLEERGRRRQVIRPDGNKQNCLTVSAGEGVTS